MAPVTKQKAWGSKAKAKSDFKVKKAKLGVHARRPDSYTDTSVRSRKLHLSNQDTITDIDVTVDTGAVMTRLRHTDPSVRASACRDFAAMEPQVAATVLGEALPPILRLFADESRSARGAAADAVCTVLNTQPPSAVTPHLTFLLRALTAHTVDKRPGVQQPALKTVRALVAAHAHALPLSPAFPALVTALAALLAGGDAAEGVIAARSVAKDSSWAAGHALARTDALLALGLMAEKGVFGDRTDTTGSTTGSHAPDAPPPLLLTTTPAPAIRDLRAGLVGHVCATIGTLARALATPTDALTGALRDAARVLLAFVGCGNGGAQLELLVAAVWPLSARAVGASPEQTAALAEADILVARAALAAAAAAAPAGAPAPAPAPLSITEMFTSATTPAPAPVSGLAARVVNYLFTDLLEPLMEGNTPALTLLADALASAPAAAAAAATALPATVAAAAADADLLTGEPLVDLVRTLVCRLCAPGTAAWARAAGVLTAAHVPAPPAIALPICAGMTSRRRAPAAALAAAALVASLAREVARCNVAVEAVEPGATLLGGVRRKHGLVSPVSASAELSQAYVALLAALDNAGSNILVNDQFAAVLADAPLPAHARVDYTFVLAASLARRLADNAITGDDAVALVSTLFTTAPAETTSESGDVVDLERAAATRYHWVQSIASAVAVVASALGAEPSTLVPATELGAQVCKALGLA